MPRTDQRTAKAYERASMRTTPKAGAPAEWAWE